MCSAIRAHGGQIAGERRAVFQSSGRRRRHPDRAAGSTMRRSSRRCFTTRSKTPRCQLRRSRRRALAKRSRKLVDGVTKLTKLEARRSAGVEGDRAGGEFPQAASSPWRGILAGAVGEDGRSAAQHADDRASQAREDENASPAKRSKSSRRSPAAWACSRFATSWRICPSPCSNAGCALVGACAVSRI